MAQYLLFVHSVDGPQIEAPQPMSPEEMQQMYAQVGRLEADLKSASAIRCTSACDPGTGPGRSFSTGDRRVLLVDLVASDAYVLASSRGAEALRRGMCSQSPEEIGDVCGERFWQVSPACSFDLRRARGGYD